MQLTPKVAWKGKKGGESETMPQKVCPACGTEMKGNKHDVYVCPNCKGAFVPEPDSIFGITSE